MIKVTHGNMWMDSVPSETGDMWTVDENRLATGGWDKSQASEMFCGELMKTGWQPVAGQSSRRDGRYVDSGVEPAGHR